MNKLLLGVTHDQENPVELERVLAFIDHSMPDSLGLELPGDYQKRKRAGRTIYFFDDIYHRVKQYKAAVTFLEEQKLWDYNGCVVEARHALQNGVSYEEVCRDLKENQSELGYWQQAKKNPYTDSSDANKYIAYHKWRVKQTRTILKLLKTFPTFEECQVEFEQTNQRREEIHLERIRRDEPFLVVVGSGHAEKYASQLSCYQFMHANEL